jgi:2-polyprenyl-6-methoxyphenol hydroxylase-like FAD-dependent oxidoreductase
VVNIESSYDKATIRTADGCFFNCQVVAGADGTHSMVRNFIQQEVPKSIPPPDCKSLSMCAITTIIELIVLKRSLCEYLLYFWHL